MMELKYPKYTMYSSLNAIACESGAESFPIRLTETEVMPSLVSQQLTFPSLGLMGRTQLLQRN